MIKKLDNFSLTSSQRSFLFHVGAPKCASSSLQKYLLNYHSSFVNTSDAYYPSNGWSRGCGRGNGGILYDFFAAPASQLYQFTDHLREEFLRMPERHTIISDEEIYGLVSPSRLAILSEVLADVGYKRFVIIVSVRSPSSWLLSDLSQHLSEGLMYEVFLEDHFANRAQWTDWQLYYNTRIRSVSHSWETYICEHVNLVPNFSASLLSGYGARASTQYDLVRASMPEKDIVNMLRERIDCVDLNEIVSLCFKHLSSIGLVRSSDANGCLRKSIEHLDYLDDLYDSWFSSID